MDSCLLRQWKCLGLQVVLISWRSRHLLWILLYVDVTSRNHYTIIPICDPLWPVPPRPAGDRAHGRHRGQPHRGPHPRRIDGDEDDICRVSRGTRVTVSYIRKLYCNPVFSEKVGKNHFCVRMFQELCYLEMKYVKTLIEFKSSRLSGRLPPVQWRLNKW